MVTDFRRMKEVRNDPSQILLFQTQDTKSHLTNEDKLSSGSHFTWYFEDILVSQHHDQ